MTEKCDHEWREYGVAKFDDFGMDLFVPCVCEKCGTTGKSWYIHSNYKEDDMQMERLKEQDVWG
jgi:hypothetical protein